MNEQVGERLSEDEIAEIDKWLEGHYVKYIPTALIRKALQELERLKAEMGELREAWEGRAEEHRKRADEVERPARDGTTVARKAMHTGQATAYQTAATHVRQALSPERRKG